MPRRTKRAQRSAPEWPASREDVPRWLEQSYRVRAVANPEEPPPAVQPDPDLPGLSAARKAAIDYMLQRGATELREQAVLSRSRDFAAVNFRRAQEAELRATEPLTRRERTEMLLRFIETFQKLNGWRVPDADRPSGVDLPLKALLMIAWWEPWWEGYWRGTGPPKAAAQSIRTLLRRRARRVR